MKKVLSLLLLTVMILNLWGCVVKSDAPVKPVAVETVQPAQTPETVPETEASVLEGNLFLKVSSITFSLAGEQDDIYLGCIPRELVTWESEDPTVVSVENGVLTAKGVGTTTIRATYYDRQVTCTAGCLAQTREELESLDLDTLRAPKRVIPEVDLEKPCTYFDSSAIVGDSIAYVLSQRESKSNYLGDVLFLARGGVSMNGFVLRYANIYYRGAETNLEDAIADSQVKRVYFLMGSNDIASEEQRDRFFDNWDIMLERIREKCPDIEIVMFSNIPQYDETPRSLEYNQRIREYNELMLTYNEKIRDYALKNGCMFLDLGYYVQDHFHGMPKIYNLDGYHLNEEGCQNWMKIMRYYAQYEAEGGTLS